MYIRESSVRDVTYEEMIPLSGRNSKHQNRIPNKFPIYFLTVYWEFQMYWNYRFSEWSVGELHLQK